MGRAMEDWEVCEHPNMIYARVDRKMGPISAARRVSRMGRGELGFRSSRARAHELGKRLGASPHHRSRSPHSRYLSSRAHMGAHGSEAHDSVANGHVLVCLTSCVSAQLFCAYGSDHQCSSPADRPPADLLHAVPIFAPGRIM